MQILLVLLVLGGVAAVLLTTWNQRPKTESEQVLATVKQIEKAVVKYAKKNGLSNQNLRFLGNQGNCKNCLDLDLSAFDCNSWGGKACAKDEILYTATAGKKGYYIIVTFPSNEESERQLELMEKMNRTEFCKQAPDNLLWARQVYPTVKNEIIECWGERFAPICKHFEKQGEKVSLANNYCEGLGI